MQVVVSLAAVPEEARPRFVDKLLVALGKLRAASGRPHWIVVDEAAQLLPARELDGSASDAAENTIYVSTDAAALSPRVLAAVDGIAACGDEAPAMIERIAAAASWPAPQLPGVPRDGQALLWFRKSERPVAMIDVAVVQAEPSSAKPEQRREKSAEVGRVLRQA